jgi:hypothetical protein
MHVVVQHKVLDRVKLAGANPQEINDGGPAGVQGLQTLPAADGSMVFCVWETPSIDTLRGYLDPTTAGVLENTYFEVDSDHALGLPASSAARA